MKKTLDKKALNQFFKYQEIVEKAKEDLVFWCHDNVEKIDDVMSLICNKSLYKKTENICYRTHFNQHNGVIVLPVKALTMNHKQRLQFFKDIKKQK